MAMLGIAVFYLLSHDAGAQSGYELGMRKWTNETMTGGANRWFIQQTRKRHEHESSRRAWIDIGDLRGWR